MSDTEHVTDNPASPGSKSPSTASSPSHLPAQGGPAGADPRRRARLSRRARHRRQLVQAAVDRAVREGLTIVPLCPFARTWLERHTNAAVTVTVDWGPPPDD